MILLYFLGEFYSLSISHKQSSIMCGCQLIYLVKFFFVIKQLGYTDTPFLVTYWCPTCVRHGYRYDSSDSSVRAESFFFRFFYAVPTRLRHDFDKVDMPTMRKKKTIDFDRWTNHYH